MKTEIEINREEYTKLFRQYYQERNFKESEYQSKHGLKGQRITSDEHPAFFKIDKKWQKRRKILDAPLLKAAKYEVGQKIKFYYIQSYNINGKYKKERILSVGNITAVQTSGDGSGEILYCFREINPPVEIVNPYCLEQNVIKIIT